jgi:putative redox protein
MKITVKRLNEAYLMEAQNEDGATIRLDTSPEHGATETAFRPMQLLLAGIGSCSTIDIIDILKKQRQPLEHIEAVVDGEREKDKVPSLYETIHVHYILFGDLDQDKCKIAIELSLSKYCSVAKTLEKTAQITYSFEVKAER